MLRFAKISLLTVVCLLVVWILPWLYDLATSKRMNSPFVMYSAVAGDFLLTDNSVKPSVTTDLQGRVYDGRERDSLCPMFFYRQLLAQERLPDTLFGQPVTPRLLQQTNSLSEYPRLS